MEELPLRERIFNILAENNGIDSYIDLRPYFSDLLSTMQGRINLRQSLRILHKDGFIELTPFAINALVGIAASYIDNSWTKNRVMVKVPELRCRLKPDGEKYLDKKVNGIISKQKEQQLILPEGEINKRDNGSTHASPIPKTLATLFKDLSTYHKLIDFMCHERLISREKDYIIWKGFRRNAKYEVVSLHDGLYDADLLFRKANNDTELTNIATNTFYGFIASERTMRNKAYRKKIKDYNEMLARFKQSLV